MPVRTMWDVSSLCTVQNKYVLHMYRTFTQIRTYSLSTYEYAFFRPIFCTKACTIFGRKWSCCLLSLKLHGLERSCFHMKTLGSSDHFVAYFFFEFSRNLTSRKFQETPFRDQKTDCLMEIIFKVHVTLTFLWIAMLICLLYLMTFTAVVLNLLYSLQ